MLSTLLELTGRAYDQWTVTEAQRKTPVHGEPPVFRFRCERAAVDDAVAGGVWRPALGGRRSAPPLFVFSNQIAENDQSWLFAMADSHDPPLIHPGMGIFDQERQDKSNAVHQKMSSSPLVKDWRKENSAQAGSKRRRRARLKSGAVHKPAKRGSGVRLAAPAAPAAPAPAPLPTDKDGYPLGSRAWGTHAPSKHEKVVAQDCMGLWYNGWVVECRREGGGLGPDYMVVRVWFDGWKDGAAEDIRLFSRRLRYPASPLEAALAAANTVLANARPAALPAAPAASSSKPYYDPYDLNHSDDSDCDEYLFSGAAAAPAAASIDMDGANALLSMGGA